jgi:hypothetical protein
MSASCSVWATDMFARAAVAGDGLVISSLLLVCCLCLSGSRRLFHCYVGVGPQHTTLTEGQGLPSSAGCAIDGDQATHSAGELVSRRKPLVCVQAPGVGDVPLSLPLAHCGMSLACGCGLSCGVLLLLSPFKMTLAKCDCTRMR